MSTALVSRLLLLAGMEPRRGMPLLRTLARCPRGRLVRIVTWCAWESGHDVPAPNGLLSGGRAIARGWDDYYSTTMLPSGAALVNLEEPGEAGIALVNRRGRIGRGWWKQDVATRGPVRAEIDVGTAWLGSLVGCIVHDDCVAHPELALACAASSADA